MECSPFGPFQSTLSLLSNMVLLKKRSNLVHFSLLWSSLDNSVNSINFSPLQSILVHFSPFWYTSVQFCPLWSISFHVGLFQPIQSISIHFGPIHFTSVHFGLNIYFGPFWSISVPIRSSITLVSLKPTRSFMEHKTVKSYNHESMRSFD